MKSRAHVFGHSLHQILISFPIALLSSSVIFDVLWRVTGSAQWPPMAFYLLEGGLAGGVVAAVFGLVDFLAVPRGTRARRVGAFHGLTSLVLLAMFGGSWMLRLGHVASPPPHALFLSFCGVAVLGAAGWLGGELVTRFAVGVEDGAHVDAPRHAQPQLQPQPHGAEAATTAFRRATVGEAPHAEPAMLNASLAASVGERRNP
jgi:uncharacterized membrane protein